MARLNREAAMRLKTAFAPKTARCYHILFRNFLAFCHCVKVQPKNVDIRIVMAYLEYLAQNSVSVHMISNNLSAIRANFVIYGLDHGVFSHPKISYFIKSLKRNRPLHITPRNIMDLKTLSALVRYCDSFR